MAKFTYISISFILHLVLCVFLFYPNVRDIIPVFVLYFGTFIFCSWIWTYKWWRVLSILLLLIISTNFSFLLFCKLEYNQVFVDEVLASIILTNTQEVFEMSLLYIKNILLGIFLICILFFLGIKTAKNTSKNILKNLSVFTVFFYVLFYIFLYFNNRNEVNGDKFGLKLYTVRFIERTPFRTCAFSYITYTIFKSLLNENKTISYSFTKKETGIDNYVILIGESARRQNMSLYGYSRNTTPNIVKNASDMLVFTNAISPSMFTIKAIPATLARGGNKLIPTNAADNIISLANQADYTTYWMSTQSSRSFDLINILIAKNASVRYFAKGEYDEVLLSKLKEALEKEDTKKKLIVLHIYGSHPDFKERYPDYENYFKKDTFLDTYDNSIRYTDKIIGKILEMLEGSKSSLLYYSDHALAKSPDKGFAHLPKKEAYQVPMFVWYSKKVSAHDKKTEWIRYPYSTSGNYYLISDWLGIKLKDVDSCSSPLKDCYIPKTTIFIDNEKKIIDYKEVEE